MFEQKRRILRRYIDRRKNGCHPFWAAPPPSSLYLNLFVSNPLFASLLPNQQQLSSEAITRTRGKTTGREQIPCVHNESKLMRFHFLFDLHFPSSGHRKNAIKKIYSQLVLVSFKHIFLQSVVESTKLWKRKTKSARVVEKILEKPWIVWL